MVPVLATLLAAVPLAPAPHVEATRIQVAPKIDGRLDDPAWSAAPPVETFTAVFPHEGAAPSERTTARVLYDDDALYVGFDCEQLHSPIRERLTRRDRDSESEWVQVIIDAKGDGKVGLAFALNVSGVLLDTIFSDPLVSNLDWDEIWEGRSARTPTGWSAEIRIPFRILRFDAGLPVQSWGFQLGRYIAQNQETLYWSYVPRDVANPIAHLGRLDNLRDLHRSGSLELRPFVTGDVSRQSVTDTTTASGYGAGASAGLDLKWHIAQDLTLDGAVLPDFSQVEADQIILNLTNYETFLPEKRPLFLEGSEVFAFPLQLFYSRRIGIAPTAPTLQDKQKLVNPISPATIYAAAKVVGRLGTDWTVGAVTALTSRNEATVLDTSTSPSTQSKLVVAPLTSHNVLRLRREWGPSGYVGLIATGASTFESDVTYPALSTDPRLQQCPSGATPALGSHCYRDSYVAGVDALWRSPSGDYTANGAFVESYVHGGPQLQQLDGTNIGSGAHAPGGWARVAKEGGRHVLASLQYTGAGRTLDYNDLGFMPRQNLHEVKASLGYRTLDAGRFTYETSSALEVTERRSLDDLDLGQLYTLSTKLRLSGFWYVFAAADAAPAHFDDREVGNGAALERGGYVGARFEVATDPKRSVFADLTGQAQVIQHDARAYTGQLAVTLVPLSQLELSVIPQVSWSSGEPRYTAETDAASRSVFGKLTATSVGGILRANYTFAPRLTLQTYAQVFLAAGHFSDLRATTTTAGQRIRLADLASAAVPTGTVNPDFEQAALNLNVVFRWEWRLGSTLFLVYSRSQVPDLANVVMPASLQPRALGARASADVILLKLSFWWAS